MTLTLAQLAALWLADDIDPETHLMAILAASPTTEAEGAFKNAVENQRQAWTNFTAIQSTPKAQRTSSISAAARASRCAEIAVTAAAQELVGIASADPAFNTWLAENAAAPHDFWS